MKGSVSHERLYIFLVTSLVKGDSPVRVGVKLIYV